MRSAAADPVSDSTESLPPPRALTEQLTETQPPAEAAPPESGEKKDEQTQKQLRYRTSVQSRTVLYTYPNRDSEFFAPSGLMSDIRRNSALPSWPTADF